MEKEDGTYQNLMAQYHRWRKHHHQGAYKTRERYDAAMSTFCRFVADTFHLQKLANLKPKHVMAFIDHRIGSGIAPATLYTDLSAIRFFLDQYSDLAHQEGFPTNEELRTLLEMPQRSFGGVDRAWSRDEYVAMVNRATERNRTKVALAMTLAYALGLRIHEVMQIDRARMLSALKDGEIAIKGKNGLWRAVPMEPLAVTVFEQSMKDTDRGQRAFVERGRMVHKQIQSVEQFIRNHRHAVEDDVRAAEAMDATYLRAIGARGYKAHLTFHGLRHSYARRKYMEFRTAGMSPVEARRAVGRLLGHGRDDVTRIYLHGTLG